MRNLALGFLILCAAGRATTLRYWVQPCADPGSGCLSSDPELAEWAMEAWQSASDGSLKLEKTNDKSRAHIRILWTGGRDGLYGEARPIMVEGVRGAEVYVLPTTDPSGGEDPLLRDAIVYLTCLHETGHALGLPHTAAFADIMYSFQYGGNIREYFDRYRRQLAARRDIRKHSGLSSEDRKRLADLYPRAIAGSQK